MKYNYLVIGLMILIATSACSQNDPKNSVAESAVVAADDETKEFGLKKLKTEVAESIISSEVEQVTVSAKNQKDPIQIARANSFFSIYSKTCAKNAPNFDKLRDKLEELPKLPDEQAKMFLKGNAGSVWPVPDDNGLFVMSLIDELSMCAVYAREADSYEVQRQFNEMFSEAPSPLIATLRPSSQKETASGLKTTLGYVWAQPGASTKTLFMVTTDSSTDAEVQAFFTASMIQE